ncbi:hypothetical protein N7533_005344 [Penicillium manginii]|uniref:uncharacterized protein n=1 Tax=Penicillium manginii TaxID=203109 RepID=UPI00254766B0|nr:uncharacterized protein N7533_005344 [Penicillium manginii]KAJ5755801.1 hypothetical protein N7533_005344 [Penicillium manginii]
MDHDEISHGHRGQPENSTAPTAPTEDTPNRDEEKMQPTEDFGERDIKVGYMNEADRHVYESGIQKFSRLGWKRLTVVLIVEAIALGSLSIPSSFATLGMVAGVILTVGLGIIAIYTSYIIGKVKLAFPEVAHYADAGRLMGARLGCPRFGFELVNWMLAIQLLFLTGSHCLTGTIAFRNITSSEICSVIFGVVSAIILLLLAVPPSFTEMAILGYIDFASIILAIGITIIATGIESSHEVGGLAAVDWSAWPKEVLRSANSHSWMKCTPPRDYVKSIWALGLIEIFIYTLTGALIYAFVGQDVGSPALLSAGNLVSRIAFGVALPVIFISGSINTVVFGRLVHGRMFANSPIRFINTKTGWLTWLAVITVGTILAFIIAEVIPFFNDLLSISSSLFISGFTFYFPPNDVEGSWRDPKNLVTSLVNLAVFLIGMVILVGGTYSSVDDIINKYNAGTVHGVFTCGSPE